MTTSYEDKRQRTEWSQTEMARATGRSYPINFDALDVRSLREIVRIIRNLDHDKRAAVNRARMVPWPQCRMVLSKPAPT